MDYEQLKLNNQLCFPLYAASRLITRAYQPQLDKLGITYPQYLVLMVLWETDGITVNEIAQKLILNTNTLTPLLKRMETQGIVRRQRSRQDERKVLISLTDQGRDMRVQAAAVPLELIKELEHSPLSLAELIDMKDKLHRLIDFMNGASSSDPGRACLKD